jgi:hypothetical protein
VTWQGEEIVASQSETLSQSEALRPYVDSELVSSQFKDNHDDFAYH